MKSYINFLSNVLKFTLIFMRVFVTFFFSSDTATFIITNVSIPDL